MYGWLSPLAFVQTLIRVLLVWSAFYFTGHMLEKPLRIKSFFPLLPKEITGIISLMFLSVILSLVGIMNRTVTPLILLVLSLPGLMLIVRTSVRKLAAGGGFSVYTAVFAVLLLGVLTANFAYASMPSLQFDDPLVTYAVQPDRWLNEGRIFWLYEVPHSGFPLVYEMTAVWPASLSFDRLDQLSVLQVFQMSMLVLALFRGMQIIGIKKKLRLPFAFTALLCTLLYFWCSLAKTDTAALLFATLALACAVYEIKHRNTRPYTSWLLMGLALATKQTSFIILVMFLPYAVKRLFRESWKVRSTAVLCLAAVPLIFAARTMLVTGSPTYPVRQIPFLVNDEWRLSPLPPEIQDLNDRSSAMHSSRHFPLIKQVGIFIADMEGISLVFLAGFILTLLFKPRKLPVLAPVFLYFAVAIWVLWPPWWGAKYSVPAYPFIGLIGLKLFQDFRRSSLIGLPVISAIALVVPGFIVAPYLAYPAAYRYSVAKYIMQGNWEENSSFKILSSSGEGMTHMWLNSYLTEPSTILSIHEEKRYFCDHTVFVAWRHPATQPLFEDNTLEDECRILDGLGIDYITFYRNNPCIEGLENRLEILDRIGENDILQPLVVVSDNFQVCRYISPLER